MTQKERMTEAAVTDAVTEKPIKFNVGKKVFAIHPPTLGKMQILSKLYLALEIDEAKLNQEPHLESMRVCSDKTDVICTLMSVATFKEHADLLDDEKIAERADFFKWHCQPEHFSEVMFALLTHVNYANFMISTRLTGIFRQNAPRD